MAPSRTKRRVMHGAACERWWSKGKRVQPENIMLVVAGKPDPQKVKGTSTGDSHAPGMPMERP